VVLGFARPGNLPADGPETYFLRLKEQKTNEKRGAREVTALLSSWNGANEVSGVIESRRDPIARSLPPG